MRFLLRNNTAITLMLAVVLMTMFLIQVDITTILNIRVLLIGIFMMGFFLASIIYREYYIWKSKRLLDELYETNTQVICTTVTQSELEEGVSRLRANVLEISVTIDDFCGTSYHSKFTEKYDTLEKDKF